MFVLLFVLRGDLLYVFPCVILFLCFSVLLALRLPRLGKRELILILVLFVRLFRLCLFRFVGFLFLLGSGKGCGILCLFAGVVHHDCTQYTALIVVVHIKDWSYLRIMRGLSPSEICLGGARRGGGGGGGNEYLIKCSLFYLNYIYKIILI